jgi:hypothetical protein
MKRVLGALAVFIGLTNAAHATVVNRTYNFKAYNYTIDGNPLDLPPVDPVIGSISVTFDNAVDYTNEGNGITLNYLNLQLGSTIVFSYSTEFDTLMVGGSNIGSNGYMWGDDDFTMFIYDATGKVPNDYAGFLGYTQHTSINSFESGAFEVTSRPSGAVPEPASWALMVGGFGLVGGAMRRRATRVRFA